MGGGIEETTDALLAPQRVEIAGKRLLNWYIQTTVPNPMAVNIGDVVNVVRIGEAVKSISEKLNKGDRRLASMFLTNIQIFYASHQG